MMKNNVILVLGIDKEDQSNGSLIKTYFFFFFFFTRVIEIIVVLIGVRNDIYFRLLKQYSTVLRDLPMRNI